MHTDLSSRDRCAGHPARSRACRHRLAIALVLLVACSDETTGPDDTGELAGRAFVVNSLGETVSVVGRGPDGRLAAQNDVAELGAGSTAVTAAVGEGVLVVPTGTTNRVLVLDAATLEQRCAATLPVGSSPNGVAVAAGHAYVSLLLDDALARIALDTCEVEATAGVGPAPVDVEVRADEVLVVVSNIDLTSGAFPPPRLGEGFVAVLDAVTLAVRDTIATGGFNAQFAAFDRQGDLLVVNSGDFGRGDGTLSVLDPVARRLVAGPFAFGDFPGDLAVGPDNRAFVTSFNDGLYVFDAGANRVERGPDDPLFAPGPDGARRGSSGADVDRNGNVLSVFFGDAATPGQVFLFDAGGALVDSVAVGLGPFAVRLEEDARP